MNTYETMKHNIPEGATHYCDDSSEFNFAWFNAKKGEVLIDGIWVECTLSAYPAGFVKPIPNEIAYRYEKVTDTGFFDLKNEFQGRMIFFNQSVASTPDYVVVMDIIELSHHYMQKNLYRRIEVTERELAVDAAIEIICKGSHDSKAAEHYRHWFEGLFDEGVLVRVNGEG